MAYLVTVSVVSLLLLMTTTETVVCKTFPTYSEELLKFVSVVNGQYSTARQVALEAKHKNGDRRHPAHMKIVHTSRAVAIPALSGLVTFYMDETFNGQLLKQMIMIVSQGWEGEFFASNYNVTDWSKFSAETTDYSNFEIGDISEIPMCKGALVKLDTPVDDVYIGNFDCYGPDTDDNYGNACTYTCKGLHAIPKGKSQEGTTLLPYDFKEIKSYPLPDYLLEGHDNFVDPCEDS